MMRVSGVCEDKPVPPETRIRIVTGGQAIFGFFGESEAVARDVGILRAADERSGKHIAAEINFGRSHQKRIAALFFAEVHCRELVGLCEVGAGSAVGFDDAFRQQVPDCLISPWARRWRRRGRSCDFHR